MTSREERDVVIYIDRDSGNHQMAIAIKHALTERFDLKNRRVKELEKRFDKIDRQMMQAQRRMALCQMRKKVRK